MKIINPFIAINFYNPESFFKKLSSVKRITETHG